MNGMHSKKKIRRYYPFLDGHLSELYTGSFIDREQSRNKTIQMILNNVLYDEFVNRTYIGESFLLNPSPQRGDATYRHKYCPLQKNTCGDVASRTTPNLLNPGSTCVFLDFALLGCRYMTRGCIRGWKPEFTRYGKCLHFNPDEGFTEKVCLVFCCASVSKTLRKRLLVERLRCQS